MAVEARRGCGFRKVGGLYLVGGTGGLPCCKLPIILHVCPTCNQGIKQSRGWQWIDPGPWLQGDCTEAIYAGSTGCPAADPSRLGDRVGLLWIGEKFYPTPESFTAEGERYGISRRIKAVPRGFKLGKHWVFLAHPKVQRRLVDGEVVWDAGIFRIFKPDAIEKIVTETQFADTEAMDKLRGAGITPIAVPDDDPDHQGTAYDDAGNGDELPLNGGSPIAEPVTTH